MQHLTGKKNIAETKQKECDGGCKLNTKHEGEKTNKAKAPNRDDGQTRYKGTRWQQRTRTIKLME